MAYSILRAAKPMDFSNVILEHKKTSNSYVVSTLKVSLILLILQTYSFTEEEVVMMVMIDLIMDQLTLKRSDWMCFEGCTMSSVYLVLPIYVSAASWEVSAAKTRLVLPLEDYYCLPCPISDTTYCLVIGWFR
ncbi:hypothetical protein Tco_0483495 [Tanacetum coccineum]